MPLTATVSRIELRFIRDDNPDLSYLEQDCFNEDTGAPDSVDYGQRRLAAYNAGEWSCYGLRAIAWIRLPSDPPFGTTGPMIVSGGLWGIESDSDESYFFEVFSQEFDDLREDLKKYGITDAELGRTPVIVSGDRS